MGLAVVGEVERRDRDVGRPLEDRVDDFRGGIGAETGSDHVPAGTAAICAELKAIDLAAGSVAELRRIESQFCPCTRRGEFAHLRELNPVGDDFLVAPDGCRPLIGRWVEQAKCDSGCRIVRIDPDVGRDQAIGGQREGDGVVRVIGGVDDPLIVHAVVVLPAGVGVVLVEAQSA